MDDVHYRVQCTVLCVHATYIHTYIHVDWKYYIN